MTYKELLDLFIDRNEIFKGVCSDYRPSDEPNAITIWLETGDVLKVKYDFESDKFSYNKEYEERIALHERVIDYKTYKLLDNLYDIKRLYGNSSQWDKAENINKAIAALKEVHEQGYTEYVLKNDH